MAKPGSSQKRRNTYLPSKADASKTEIERIPAENAEILKEYFGFDITSDPPERLRQIVSMAASISSSPLPSPEMLEDYRARGFPELIDKIISIVDEQREHRLSLEKAQFESAEKRKNFAQKSAALIGFLSLAGSLIGGYFGVPYAICIAVAVIGVGGPSTATVVSRMLDKSNK
jgi:uncharacterized membrane protein